MCEYFSLIKPVNGNGNYLIQIFVRFNCGRWLSKNQDDGSTERLLVADLVTKKQTTEQPKRASNSRFLFFKRCNIVLM